MKILSFKPFYPIPAPVPTAGIPPDVKTPLIHLCFIMDWLLCSIPDFGRFYGSRGLYMFGCRARQKPPSSLTRTRVHRRTGLRGKGQGCPLRFWTGATGSAGAVSAPLPGYGLRVFGRGAIQARQRLESFRRLSGMPAYAPYPLRRGTPSALKHPKTLAGRAGEPKRAFLQVFRNPLPLADPPCIFV
jgi:hypothetical protein